AKRRALQFPVRSSFYWEIPGTSAPMTCRSGLYVAASQSDGSHHSNHELYGWYYGFAREASAARRK
ncbi:MAG: hypothetical protein WBV76_06740, partial [Pseudolabrys sp.]